MPIKVSTSQISIVLIVLSKGEELLKEGRTLTSKSQGFRFLSIKTSKP